MVEGPYQIMLGSMKLPRISEHKILKMSWSK